ncbi:MAG: hypothetical protein OEN21_04395 [Myxococcales bacterium]|nr:hypothetical protein [Myxococcales bacterium]
MVARSTPLMIAAAAACWASLMGCSKDSGQRLEYELFENTKELDADTLALLTSLGEDQATLTFSGSTELLDGLAPPNILLSGASEETPHGLLRQVTSVDRSGDEVFVQTEPTTVFHAFRRLDVAFASVVGDETDTLKPPAPPQGPASLAALSIEFPLGGSNVPVTLFDGDGLIESTEDQIAGATTMQAKVKIDFWLKFDWETFNYAEASAALADVLDVLEDLAGVFTGDLPTIAELINLRTGLTLSGVFDTALNIQGKSALSYDKDLPLGGYPLEAIFIGPLVFVPQVTLDADFSGGVTGDMKVGYGVGAEAGIGFEYDADQDDLLPRPIIIGPKFTHSEPNAMASISATAFANVELKLHISLWGLFGPYASIAAFSELDVDRSRTPCYQLRAGLRGGSGASFVLAGTTLASIHGPSFALGDPMDLASGDCEPLPDPPPTDAPITPWSRSYADTIWSTGTDDGWTNLELGHDGRYLVTSTGTDRLLKVNQDGSLVWALAFERPAIDGGLVWPNQAVPMADTGTLVSTHQYVLVKIGADGAYHWAAQIESDNADEGFWAAKQVNGDVWLAGTYRLEGESDREAWLLVLGPDGAVKTSWTWGGTPDRREAIRGILPLDDGALLVGHATQPGDTRGFVLRVTADGTIAWAKHVDACDDEQFELSTAIQTQDGNLVIAGWHYSVDTRALLFRLAPDGSDDAPAWATGTVIDASLGLQPRSIHQLATGELRLVGLSAATLTQDEVFAAGTDSIGRFAWLKVYGGPVSEGAPTSRVTSQGGLFVAAPSSSVEEEPGGLWMFEVPMLDGAIDFAPGGGVSVQSPAFTSAPVCVTTPAASNQTTPRPIGLTSIAMEVSQVTPAVHQQ